MRPIRLSRVRRIATVAVLLLVPTALATSAALFQPPLVESRALFIVRSDDSSAGAASNLTSLLGAIESQNFLTPVAKERHVSPATLINRVSSSQVASGNVIELRVQDPSPAQARAIAQQIIARFRDLVASVSGQGAEIAYLNDRISATDNAAQKLKDRLSTLASSSSASDRELRRQLETRSDQLEDQLTDLQEKLSAAESLQAAARTSVHLVGSPYILPGLAQPQPLRLGAAGAAIGLILAVAYLLAERRLTVFIESRSSLQREIAGDPDTGEHQSRGSNNPAQA